MFFKCLWGAQQAIYPSIHHPHRHHPLRILSLSQISPPSSSFCPFSSQPFQPLTVAMGRITKHSVKIDSSSFNPPRCTKSSSLVSSCTMCPCCLTDRLILYLLVECVREHLAVRSPRHWSDQIKSQSMRLHQTYKEYVGSTKLQMRAWFQVDVCPSAEVCPRVDSFLVNLWLLRSSCEASKCVLLLRPCMYCALEPETRPVPLGSMLRAANKQRHCNNTAVALLLPCSASSP